MNTIKGKEEIIENLKTLERYLCEGTEEEREFAIKLIKKGRCFITYQVNGEIRFSPSRFIGYQSNTKERHINNKWKDGKETNPVITKTLETPLESNEELKTLHEAYCLNFGVTPDRVKKKFWGLNGPKAIIISNKDKTNSVSEGTISERIHIYRERNQTVVKIAKENFKEKHGKLFCQACNFSFEEKYGRLGDDFIEGHHIIPVSEMKPNHRTKPEEIALVCANCHRMIHHKKPWLSINELKEILKS